MRAGLLRKSVDLYSVQETQTASGFVKKGSTLLGTMRCREIENKEYGATAGKETINRGNITLQIRRSTMSESATTLKFEGQKYSIDKKYLQPLDNTYKINATLVNE